MIIQISGKLRQGKGILLTLYALAFCQVGGKVLSNYTIKHKNAVKIDYYDFMSLLRQPAPKQLTMICIDELPTWIDSYCTTSSKSNRMASHFCNQSAKLGYELRYTTQRTRRADINYREMVDQSLKAEKQPLCGRRLCVKNCPNLMKCKYVYHILDPEIIDDDVDTGRTIKIPFGLASLWWNRYDTFEPVIPLGLDEFFFELEKTDPVRLDRAVDRQVHLLTDNKYRGNCSVLSVKSALLKLHESVCFADLVSVRLKEPNSITPQSPQQPTQ